VRILIVEDDQADRGRLLRLLRKGFPGAELVEITQRKTFHQALEDGVDVIISEYQLRWAKALSLLKIITQRAPQSVVIWVSHMAPAEAVAAGMQCGLSGYVSKRQLRALVPAVRASLKRLNSARHAQDITQHKHPEQSGDQAQRIEAMGRLAGWMAHDFNNVLQGVLGYSDILLRRMTGRHPLRHYVQQIYNMAVQGTQLTRQLIAISRRPSGEPHVLELSRLLNSMTPVLQHLLGEDIEMITRIAPGLGYVPGEEGEVEQVLLNLTLNARDAMTQGGRLIIEAENVDLDESSVGQSMRTTQGAYVLLTMQDTGCGMDATTLAHVFEPFFTTKEHRKGIGLGLFTTYSIITMSGGYIMVESAVGEGTTFRVYLPRIDDSAELDSAEQSPPPLLSHGETILLVEDEAVVKDIARQILQESGYTVLEASSGEEAIPLGQAHHGTIHLLLTDLVLPGMSGRDVAKRLLRLQPHMRILYISGYAPDRIAGRGASEARGLFLQKPFTPNTLRQKVREALDAAT
jgi:two-component system cell cycle sensor histidine kinase/response regulator CckA